MKIVLLCVLLTATVLAVSSARNQEPLAKQQFLQNYATSTHNAARRRRRRRKSKSVFNSKKFKKVKKVTKKAPPKPKFVKTVKKASKTVKKASKTVKKVSKQASKSVNENLVKSCKNTAKFSEKAFKGIKDIAQDVVDNTQKYAKAIKKFFKGFDCKVSPEDLEKIASQLISVNPKTISKLRNGTNFKDLSDGVRTVKQAACMAAWATAEVVGGLPLAMMTFLGQLKSKCPRLKEFNPALSLEVGLTLSASVGYSYSVTSAAGLAIDSNGNKFCYAGGCIGAGFSVPPIPDADADVGFTVNLWKTPSAIPGNSKGLAISGEIGLLGVGIELGITYIYADKLEDFLGIGLSGSVGPDLPVSASAGFETSLCTCPVCISTEGKQCK